MASKVTPDVDLKLSFKNMEPFKARDLYEIDWNKFPSNTDIMSDYNQVYLNPSDFEKYIIPQYSLVSSDERYKSTSISFSVITKSDSKVSMITINKVLAIELYDSKTIKKSSDEHIKAKFELLR